MSLARENADRTRSMSHIGRSLSSWFKKECNRLQIERQLFREELDRRRSRGESEADIHQALRENQQEQSQLERGWANSTVRRHIESRAAKTTAGGAEQRSIVTASTTPSMRADTTTSRRTAKSLYGYAAKFDVEADLGYFRERIQKGAFAEALKTSDVRCLFNHDSNHLLGRTSAATLELSETSFGLRFCTYLLPFDPLSYSLARRIDRGDISGCSFFFTIAKDRWQLARKPGDVDLRIIEKIDRLYDVGPVTFPAYPQTSVSVTFEKVTAPARSEAKSIGDMTVNEYEQWEYDQITREARLNRAPISPERMRQVLRGYRKAGRILNSCRSKLS